MNRNPIGDGIKADHTTNKFTTLADLKSKALASDEAQKEYERLGNCSLDELTGFECEQKSTRKGGEVQR